MSKNKRIAIDARAIANSGTGLCSYTDGIIKSCIKFENNYDFVFIIQKDDPYIETLTTSSRILILETTIRKGDKFRRDLWQQFTLPRILDKHAIDLYHGLDYAIPFGKTKFKKVVTLHDTAVFTEYDGRQLLFKKILRLNFKFAVKYCDQIITDSNFSKDEIIKHFPNSKDKVTMIQLGINEIYITQKIEALNLNVLKKTNHCKNYLLYYGGFRKNKNVELLLHAFDLLKNDSDLKLILVGNPGDAEMGLKALVNSLNLDERVIFYGFATEEELVTLLDNCRLFVFPSLFEGYGLPVLEAMTRGAAIVCSNKASLPEIGGNSIHYFNINSPESLAQEIQYVLNNENYYNKLKIMAKERSQLLTWESSSRNLLAVYDSLLTSEPVNK